MFNIFDQESHFQQFATIFIEKYSFGKGTILEKGQFWEDAKVQFFQNNMCRASWIFKEGLSIRFSFNVQDVYMLHIARNHFFKSNFFVYEYFLIKIVPKCWKFYV